MMVNYLPRNAKRVENGPGFVVSERRPLSKNTRIHQGSMRILCLPSGAQIKKNGLGFAVSGRRLLSKMKIICQGGRKINRQICSPIRDRGNTDLEMLYPWRSQVISFKTKPHHERIKEELFSCRPWTIPRYQHRIWTRHILGNRK
ncbi:hypothetical protein EJB05_52669 [Eragrostis curvula]|uniref:Uncharacterized protein n=1 Tax=Eragrostis curvula TaxID=38414 RepID=A0A5J9SSB0_9POAL|nr:hypothetical protein EJB05_52669 [Eragrostis curvula]